MQIGILDYGLGNIRSIENAIQRLNIAYFVSSTPESLDKADKIIFPGVGHAHLAMTNLTHRGLDTLLVNCKKPVLGICLGMQLLYESTEEGDTKGLGIFPGKVTRFVPNNGEKVPHMGWNFVTGGETGHKLISSERTTLFNSGYYYFVHSYYAPITQNTIGTTHFCINFTSIVKKDNFLGVQFHPEKSGDLGVQLLTNFIDS